MTLYKNSLNEYGLSKHGHQEAKLILGYRDWAKASSLIQQTGEASIGSATRGLQCKWFIHYIMAAPTRG